MCSWHTDRQIDRSTEQQSPEKDLKIWTTDVSKGVNTIQRRKDCLFNKTGWNNWKSTCQKKILDPYLISNANSK